MMVARSRGTLMDRKQGIAPPGSFVPLRREQDSASLQWEIEWGRSGN